eukprot:7943187-Prorocentrum_lima.AAC.1
MRKATQSTLECEDDPDPNRHQNGERDPFGPHLLSGSFAATIRQAEDDHRLDLVKMPPEFLGTPFYLD